MPTLKVHQLTLFFLLFLNFLQLSLAWYAFRRISQRQNELLQDYCQNPEFKLPAELKYAGKKHKVIGGQFVNAGKYPWAAAIVHPSTRRNQYSSGAFCGATIISPRHLISARHCFESVLKKGSLDQIRVYVGGVCTDQNPAYNCPNVDMQPKVIEFAAYQSLPPGMTSDDMGLHGVETDIAIIQLTEDLDFRNPNLGIACLPHAEAGPNTVMHVYGWGLTEKQDNSPHLKDVNLPLIQQDDPFWNNEKCQSPKLYCMRIANSNKDGAIGDSGTGIVGMHGPLARFFGVTVASISSASGSMPDAPGNVGLRVSAFAFDICRHTGVCSKREWTYAPDSNMMRISPYVSLLTMSPGNDPQYYQYTTIFDPTSRYGAITANNKKKHRKYKKM